MSSLKITDKDLLESIVLFFFLSRLRTHRGAQLGAQTHDRAIKTWAKIKNQMPKQLSHPGTLG